MHQDILDVVSFLRNKYKYLHNLHFTLKLRYTFITLVIL